MLVFFFSSFWNKIKGNENKNLKYKAIFSKDLSNLTMFFWKHFMLCTIQKCKRVSNVPIFISINSYKIYMLLHYIIQQSKDRSQ